MTGLPPRVVRLQLLTESRQKTHRRCQREEQIRYQLGYVPLTNAEALRFGTAMHKGLEAWWTGIDGTDRLGCALEAVQGLAADPFEAVRLECLLIGYDVRWKGETYETIAVEQEFRAPLLNPETKAASKTFERAGKLDVIAKDAKGRTVIIEHKTSGEDISPGSSYWARVRMDGQISGYFRGAEALGHEVEACIYDVIGKVSLRPYKKSTEIKLKKDGTPYANCRLEDETPEEYRARVLEHIAANPDDYYQRAEIVRLESELRAYDLETWQQAVQMRDAQRLGIAPRNPDACSRFGQICSYFEVCSGAASLEDERFTKLAWAHPELTPVERGDSK